MSIELTKSGDNIFSGHIQGSYHKHAIFGGTILGQSILAAYNTVTDAMHLHSFQLYFLIRGDPNHILNYVVESLMDGRSFVKRSVNVKQKDVIIAKMSLSFKLDEPQSQFSYFSPFPKVIGHDKCPLLTKTLEEKLSNLKDKELLTRLQGYSEWLADFPVHVKLVDPEVQILCKENPTNKIFKWLKLRDDKLMDIKKNSSKHALLGFISDYAILQPILTMHCSESVGFMISLDHIMWFHNHKFDATQWMLLEAECIISNNGTSLNTGRIWSQDGSLLATIMQEGVVRPLKSKN